MKNVLITGGTGLVGTRLTELLLEKGYSVSLLDRKKSGVTGQITRYHWDPEKGEIDEKGILQADYMINLAGASIAGKRWTAERKKELYNSRVGGTMLLFKKLETLNHRLKAFVSASAIGYYGDQGDKWLTENMPPGNDFLAKLCVDWEAQAQKVAGLGIRTVICRTAIVLSLRGGALPEMTKSMQFGVVAYLGDGKEYYSWIHLDDLCRFYIAALENEQLAGVYNVTGNDPVPHKELILAVREAKKSHALVVPAPEFALKIALGEMADSLVASHRCSNEKLRKSGFELKYPNLRDALRNLYS